MTAETSFWARRRAAVKAEEEADLLAAREAARAQELEGKTDAEVLVEMGLPEPGSMTQGDDFAAFMSRDVPEHLRKRALRTLWRSNPVLACLDGLNDYDEDYRAAMSMREPVKTAYQVGLGMKTHLDEMQRKLDALQIGDKEGADAVPPVRHMEEQAREPKPRVAGEESLDASAFVDREREPEQHAPVVRRMRFRFEEDMA
jgi:hypothetical protein